MDKTTFVFMPDGPSLFQQSIMAAIVEEWRAQARNRKDMSGEE
jgi:hypothetical protein